MTCLRLSAAAAKLFLRRLCCAAAIVTLFSVGIGAQQPAVGRQRNPRLTTDDVARPPVEQPVAEPTEAGKPEATGKPAPADSKAAKPDASEPKTNPEEAAWQERVSKARAHAKETERAAEEAELRITAIRNELGTSGQSAKFRNQTAAELEQAGQQLKDLRAQARTAADDLAQLVEYGKQKGFAENEGPKPVSAEGKPNEQYYGAQAAKLNEALESAQRRIQLYENRVRDLNQQIMINSGGKDKSGNATGGDNFYIGQLRQDRDEAQQKLDEARSALAKAQTDLDTLKEEARRAGVPPGVFR